MTSPMPNALVRPWYARLPNILSWKFANRGVFQTAYKRLFIVAVMCDMATQAALEGVRAGFPGYDTRTDNLSLIGQGRGLVQGETETPSHFGQRLVLWIQTAKMLGSDLGLAAQLCEWLGNRPMVRIWSRKGQCVTVAGAASVSSVSNGIATITGLSGMVGSVLRPGMLFLFDAANPGNNGLFRIVSYLSTSSVTIANANAVAGDTANGSIGWGTWSYVAGGLNWDGTSNPERANSWWDNWVVVYPTEFATQPAINTGNRTGVIPSTDPRRQQGVGHACSRTQVDTVNGLIRTWKGQHAVVRLIVWSYDATLFDPANPSASGNPNGLWGRGSFWGSCPSGTVGSGVGLWPSRNRTCRYWVPPSA